MSDPSHGGTSTADDALLHDTQAYLGQLLQRQAPDALLTYAWDDFFRVYSTVVRRLVSDGRALRQQAEDLVQEVWLEVLRHLPGLHPDTQAGGLRAWLYRVVCSKIARACRREARHRAERLEEVAWQGHEPADHGAGPVAEVEQRLDQELLHVLVAELRAQLGEVDTRVLELRLLAGRPAAEVAAAVGLSEKKVRKRQARLTARLRQMWNLYKGRGFGRAAGPPGAGGEEISEL